MNLNELLILVSAVALGISFLLHINHPKKVEIKFIQYEEYLPKIIDYEILGLINTYRLENGLEELGMTSIGNDISYAHVTWLSTQQIETVKDFREKGHYYFQQRVDQIQLRLGKNVEVGENGAWNYRTALGYFNGWRNSPGHNANMLGDYTHLGIATNDKFCETIYIKI